MKRVALEQLPQDVADLIKSAQMQRVVITRNGQPYALLVGIENKDEEDLELEFSPEFWRMIEESRRSTVSIPLKDVMAELEAQEQLLKNKAGEESVKTPATGS